MQQWREIGSSANRSCVLITLFFHSLPDSQTILIRRKVINNIWAYKSLFYTEAVDERCERTILRFDRPFLDSTVGLFKVFHYIFVRNFVFVKVMNLVSCSRGDKSTSNSFD